MPSIRLARWAGCKWSVRRQRHSAKGEWVAEIEESGEEEEEREGGGGAGFEEMSCNDDEDMDDGMVRDATAQEL